MPAHGSWEGRPRGTGNGRADGFHPSTLREEPQLSSADA